MVILKNRYDDRVNIEINKEIIPKGLFTL